MQHWQAGYSTELLMAGKVQLQPDDYSTYSQGFDLFPSVHYLSI